MVIAKIVPDRKQAYVSFQGKEHSVKEYEVLCGTGFSWIPAANGSIPPDALVAGRTKDNEILYVGRAHYNFTLTPGKVHPSHGCLYIGFGGQEIKIATYEVLCVNVGVPSYPNPPSYPPPIYNLPN